MGRTHYAKARVIMGQNFLGPYEVHKEFGIMLDSDRFAEVPWSTATLRACKDTHVLVAGAPLTISEIGKLVNVQYQTEALTHSFINERKVRERWHLFQKDAVLRSHGKEYLQQAALLTAEEEVPFACEMTYMVILYRLTLNGSLLDNLRVWCQDKVMSTEYAVVGYQFRDGLCIDSRWETYRNGDLGLASTRKPESR